ncbi:hypothetical protein SD074_20870 [Prolixibacter sp. SD074]|nr:hypothetical protein SD074_20870 [Prolixibacter sp. SD074]
MKRICLLVFTCVFISHLSAQNVKIISEGITLDTLNGRVMRVRKGRVLRIVDGENKFYLISRDGKSWLPGGSVLLTNKQGPHIGIAAVSRPEISSYQKGYFGTVQAGILLGNRSEKNDAPFSFSILQGYRLNAWFAPGFETGIDFFDDGVMPLHATASFFFSTGQFTPILSVKGGWSIPLAREKAVNTYYSDFYYNNSYYGGLKLETKGGTSLNPEFSIMRMMNNDVGWIFSCGYRFQRLTYQQGEKGDTNYYKKERDINRLSLRVGLLFR